MVTGTSAKSCLTLPDLIHPDMCLDNSQSNLRSSELTMPLLFVLVQFLFLQDMVVLTSVCLLLFFPEYCSTLASGGTGD